MYPKAYVYIKMVDFNHINCELSQKLKLIDNDIHHQCNYI
jgi:hypothetical protein